MTRGNQREVDRARAQARAAKHGKQNKQSGADQQQNAMNHADIMREKQRKADLRAQGIDPDTVDNANQPAKQYDTSWMQQYEQGGDDDDEEEKKEEVPSTNENVGQAAAAS